MPAPHFHQGIYPGPLTLVKIYYNKLMLGILLRTKLFAPPLRPNFIARPRLLDQLNLGLQQGHKLTLIAAPAGFGKTTLAAEWLVACQQPTAWLSLDKDDNDPIRFITYLVAALQTLPKQAALGATVIELLEANQPPAVETILTALINEIIGYPDQFILALDDYHLLGIKEEDQLLTFLLEQLPAHMHLVITTREDPHVPLPRFRARGQLTEIRATDLRFTQAEAAGFLNQMMGLTLSVEEIDTLERRTEGWVAGLQLAALSMHGRQDTASFIQAFSGSHHFVIDYLAEEVLGQQSPQVRSFLLQTAILDRLAGPLCEAVSGQEDSQKMLESLERANLFLIRLDDKREWYRYHHLFGEVLRARALAEIPDEIPQLHLKASEWHEQNGSFANAIQHALAAEDFQRAASLLEVAWRKMDLDFQGNTWLNWVQALPSDIVAVRPVLSVGYAWTLLGNAELATAELRLVEAESWLGIQRDDPLASEMVIVDEEEFQNLEATIASARAYLAQMLGDIPASILHAKRALELLPETAYAGRAAPAALLGLTYWVSGDLEGAHHAFSAIMEGYWLSGKVNDALDISYVLADLRIALGRLHEALNIYRQSLQLIGDQGEVLPRGAANLYLGLGELYQQFGDTRASQEQLQKSEAVGERAALPDWQHRLCIVQAWLLSSRGKFEAALEQLDKAERIYYRSPMPDTRPIPALRARLWLRQGRLSEAMGWLRERGLTTHDDLHYLSEFEHLTMVRVLTGRSPHTPSTANHADVSQFLNRLLAAAEKGGRMGSVIEILILQATILETEGDLVAALVPFERALALAEPQGYVQIFLDEGAPVARLLHEAANRGIASDYVQRLRSGIPATFSARLVLDPLSEREAEVLKLLGTELSGPEIARELMVSLNTMRTHTKNIYAKLGVNSRRAAVRRAEELELL